MDTLEQALTGQVLLRHFSSLLSHTRLLVLDANLSAEALQVSSLSCACIWAACAASGSDAQQRVLV